MNTQKIIEFPNVASANVTHALHFKEQVKATRYMEFFKKEHPPLEQKMQVVKEYLEFVTPHLPDDHKKYLEDAFGDVDRFIVNSHFFMVMLLSPHTDIKGGMKK